jgi:hypothetical protein
MHVSRAARRWLITAETRIQTQVTSSDIRGGRSGTAADFSEFFGFFLVVFIPSLLLRPACLSPSHEVCDSPDQAVLYHIHGHKVGASSLPQHLAGLGVKVVLYRPKHRICFL